MVRSVLALSAAFFPAVAFAQSQGGQVPAPNAVAQAGMTQTTPAVGANMSATTVGVPAGFPPPVVHQLGPNPTLNAKEGTAVRLSGAWQKHYDPPTRGEDGTVQWVYGSSLPSIVCAPLRACDLALEPGEVVNNINVGDKVRWSVMPGITGVGPERTTHLIFKPYDAGLVSNVMIYTDRRMYSIQLKSMRADWTPMTAFSYPESAQAAWAAYGATMSSAPRGLQSASSSTQTGTVGRGYGGVEFYRISGSAPWKPLHVYSTGGKTIIEFPERFGYSGAPVLVGVARGGGWFSSSPDQMIQYRISGNTFVVDSVLDHAKLVTGVGGAQQRVDIERGQ